MLTYLFWTVVSFFSGSVMYSYLIPKCLFGKDITKLSKDGNPGCGNVFTCVGIPCGILCLLLELAKGAFPVWLALQFVSLDNILFAGVMAAPVLGHAFSPMLKRRGGKGIAVTFGALIGLCPHSLLLFMLAVPMVLFSTVLRITPHSLRVMISYCAMLGSSFFFDSRTSLLIGAAMITATVIYRHMADYLHREKMQYGVYIFSLKILEHNGKKEELSHSGKA